MLDDVLVNLIEPLVKRMVREEVDRQGFQWSWLSPAQAGRVLGLSAGAVRKRFHEGRLPGVVEEGRIYIDMRAYDEQLRQAESVP